MIFGDAAKRRRLDTGRREVPWTSGRPSIFGGLQGVVVIETWLTVGGAVGFGGGWRAESGVHIVVVICIVFSSEPAIDAVAGRLHRARRCCWQLA